MKTIPFSSCSFLLSQIYYRGFAAVILLPRFFCRGFSTTIFLLRFFFRCFFAMIFLPHFFCRDFFAAIFLPHFFSINNTCPNNLSQNKYSIGYNRRPLLFYTLKVSSSRSYLLTNFTQLLSFRANPLLTTCPLTTTLSTNSNLSTSSCN
jgi:hypothetical protein